MAFVKATKKQAKGRIALIGPSGSGKTWTALEWATALLAICKPGARIRVIDSERGSASKYAGERSRSTGAPFDFDADEEGMHDFSPKSYRQKMAEATADGQCGVLIIDSLSHAWMGKGGALEMVDKAQARQKTANSFTAWRDVTPEHNELVDSLIQCPAHLIVTMRAKSEYVLQEDERGKKVPKKIGMAPIQRDGLEFEFDLVGDMDADHNTFTESKTRCSAMKGAALREPSVAHLAPFVAWLTDGAPVVEKPKAQPKPAAQQEQVQQHQQEQQQQVQATPEQVVTYAALMAADRSRLQGRGAPEELDREAGERGPRSSRCRSAAGPGARGVQDGADRAGVRQGRGRRSEAGAGGGGRAGGGRRRDAADQRRARDREAGGAAAAPELAGRSARARMVRARESLSCRHGAGAIRRRKWQEA
jgi:hypothetical protein